jgi:NO-binding membrane sensor protein with MHYT domain
MRQALLSIRNRMDRFGVLLSGLCALHCVAGIVLVGMLGLGGPLLLAPEVHQIGLALAVAVGFVSLGFGVARHGRVAPLVIGAVGLSLMAGALFVGHGLPEAVLTIGGVALVAAAHILNLRSPHLHEPA